MRKKQEVPNEADDDSTGIYGVHKKKHKKHKKHKRKHDSETSFSSETLETVKNVGKPQLKLKIKIGNQTLANKSVPQYTVEPGATPSTTTVPATDSLVPGTNSLVPGTNSLVLVTDIKEEEEESFTWIEGDMEPPVPPEHKSDAEEEEEQRWLDALEKGELDDNGDLKKEVDESLLTPRQRALLRRDTAPSQPLLELPMGYKEKEMTEEMMLKRAERAHKRRLQAAKKAEESKKQTIERLTKTNRAKVKAARERQARRHQAPMVHYCNTPNLVTLTFPPGFPVPLTESAKNVAVAPPVVYCGLDGCSNIKVYSCSKTGVPLCSLACYKKNLQLKGY
uniref:INO80 complex subunit B-like isoform X3 n=1 Tax=Myxine glutinosa TaxID=7769 RepID=UPI00358DDF30